jgi:Kef-type K+ transport system membrane component KefB
MFGLVIPKETRLIHACNEKIEGLVLTFMLPLYFALSGLNTDISKVHSNKQWGMVALVVFAATMGKFIGCGGCALISGMTVRYAEFAHRFETGV